MQTTITEALADIKTSLARIEKKRTTVSMFLGRDSRLRDPHESIGGSAEFVRRERQSILDLEEKIVRIRSAIQQANMATVVDIEGEKRTLAAWLNWRREIALPRQKYLAHMAAQVNNLRQQAVRNGQPVKQTNDGAATATGELIIVIDETNLAGEADRLERVLGTLDGRLSLINATTTIDV
jgi:hypothetical protein